MTTSTPRDVIASTRTLLAPPKREDHFTPVCRFELGAGSDVVLLSACSCLLIQLAIDPDTP